MAVSPEDRALVCAKLAMDGCEESRQVGELYQMVVQLLVSGSHAAYPSPDAELRRQTIQGH